MISKLITGIMLTLLLLSMLKFPFNTQPVEAEPSGPPTEWDKTYGGAGNEHAYSVIQTSDGGYALAGLTDSFGAGNYDVWLVKVDSSGNHEWNKTYGGSEFEWVKSVIQTSDGGYALAGGTLYVDGSYDFWLAKVNSSGNHEWNKTYGGAGNEAAYSVVETPDGGYALAGYVYASPSTGYKYDFWLVKTDSAGNKQWDKTYGGTGNEHGSIVIQTSDGGYALAGHTDSFGAGNYDAWLVKVDSSGNHEWNKTCGRSEFDSATSVIQTGDGGYALAGRTNSSGAGSYDFWLVKVNSSGNHEWNKTYGGTGAEDAYSLIQTGDGGYALAGSTDSSGAGSRDFWLVKVDSAGYHEWNKTYGGSGLDEARSVVQTSDGGYALAGYTNSFGAGSFDFWLVKVAGPRIYVDPPIIYAGIGETFSINVSVADVTNLYGFEFKLDYNTTLLDATDAVVQPFLNEPIYVLKKEINHESGFVWVAVTSGYPAEAVNGSGTLVTITFQVTGLGECVLDLYDTKLSDPDGSPIDHSVEDGFYEGGMTQVVSTESPADSRLPSLAVDSSGNVHVAWEDDTDYAGCGTDLDIFYKRYEVGSGWTSTEVVSTESTANSHDSSLAVDSSRNVHIAWYDATDYAGCGTDLDIFYKRYVVGVGWTTTEVVSTESTKYSCDPSLAVDSNGNVHVAWYDATDFGSGGDIDIFYKRYEVGGNWTFTEVVSTESTANSYYPSLAVDQVGNVHVAWYDNTDYAGSGTDYDIFYKRYEVGSGWTFTEVVSTESTALSRLPSLAVDSSGNVHVAWEDDTDYAGCGTDLDIFYKRYVVGVGWTTTEVVSTNSTADSYRPSLAVDSSRNVHVAWYDYTNYGGSGADADIFYKRYEVGVGWTSTQVVSTESPADSKYPSLAVDSSRNVHVAWEDDTDYAGCGTDRDIFYKYLRVHSTQYSWPMFRHNLRNTGYTESPGPGTSQIKWTYTTGDWVFSSPAVADGVVFVGSYDGKVYALDQHTGAHIWNFTTGGDVRSSPAVADGRVYVGIWDNHKVYCLDAATGAHIWNFTTGGVVESSPAVADGKVYVGSLDGKVYCLDALTGAHIWTYTTGAAVRSSPAVADGVVFVGSYDGKVYALDQHSGAHIWNYTTGEYIYSSPAVADGRVYVGLYNGRVYCLNALTGAHVWNYTTGDWVWSSPAVANDRVYVGSEDGKVYCLNAVTGAHIWNYPTGGAVYSSPAVAKGKVYVGSYNGKVYCLDAGSGAHIWNYTTGNSVWSSPAVADGMVFIGSHDHAVYAFGVIIRVPEDYPTVQAAINAAQGTTILVAPGIYHESIVINKTLTILGKKGSSTEFAGGGSGIAVTIQPDAPGTIIANVVITNWDQGIFINNTNNCEIYDNIMYYMGDSGIVLEGNNAANILIESNIIYSNNIAINLTESSTSNTIYNNTISSNNIGLYLESGGNTIYANTISANNFGINMTNSDNNVIYWNNFIGNTYEQAITSNSFGNIWDNGYPSGGNFWSDYAGVDEKSGPNQDQFGSDGIGDTPYVIDGNNQDNYPLMNPIHEITVTEVTPYKTVVGKSYSLKINATVANRGRYGETLKLTLYANILTIDIPTETFLTSGDSATITFTWNTAGFAYGSYTIKAVADTIQGEIFTDDNTHINGEVFVTIPGDVDSDLDVDYDDFIVLAGAYGSSIGQPAYEPHVDFDCDGYVDYDDFIILAGNYGTTV